MTDGPGIVEGYDLIDPSEYPVKYDSYELIRPRGLNDRLLMWFVIPWGDCQGALIPYFCPVQIKNRKTGEFGFRKNSKFLKTIAALTGRKHKRGDRLSPEVLKGLKLVAEVVTVGDKQDGSKHNEDDRYSKIERLELEP